MPRGKLARLYRARLCELPPKSKLPASCLGATGQLGVFAYAAGECEGHMILFLPDNPNELAGRTKLRPGPGTVRVSRGRCEFSPDGGGPYAWLIEAELYDTSETEAFATSAAASDRVIEHLLKMATDYNRDV